MYTRYRLYMYTHHTYTYVTHFYTHRKHPIYALNTIHSLPRPASSGGGDLQVVTLQNNSLTGTIPPSLTNGSNICILLLNDNRLRGRLPPLSPSLFRPKCTIYSGYQVSSQFRPAILVHNNRLSCSLPGAPLALGASRHHYVGANECGNNSYPQCLRPGRHMDQCASRKRPAVWCVWHVACV